MTRRTRAEDLNLILRLLTEQWALEQEAGAPVDDMARFRRAARAIENLALIAMIREQGDTGRPLKQPMRSLMSPLARSQGEEAGPPV